MKHPAVVEPEALLGELTQAGVEFIVVRGTAAILHAAPVTTQDLDIVHRRTPENVVRLMGVLTKLDAVMRYDLANRSLRPTSEMLLGRGQVNLSTTLGPLDPLCELGEGQGFTYCGRIGDGCGQALDCGACPDGQACGELVPSVCGSPMPPIHPPPPLPREPPPPPPPPVPPPPH